MKDFEKLFQHLATVKIMTSNHFYDFKAIKVQNIDNISKYHYFKLERPHTNQVLNIFLGYIDHVRTACGPRADHLRYMNFLNFRRSKKYIHNRISITLNYVVKMIYNYLLELI